MVHRFLGTLYRVLGKEFASDAQAHREGHLVRFVRRGAVAVGHVEVGVHEGVHLLIRRLETFLHSGDALGLGGGRGPAEVRLRHHGRRAREREEDGLDDIL